MVAVRLNVLLTTLALLSLLAVEPALAQETVTPAEARAIAKEAYIYGFPMVDNYRVQYSYFVDANGPEFKATWNHIHNTARVYTPDTRRSRRRTQTRPILRLAWTCEPSPLSSPCR
jgi:hypothetical protein